MPDPFIPATVIGSWAFPGWYETFIQAVAQAAHHMQNFGLAGGLEHHFEQHFSFNVEPARFVRIRGARLVQNLRGNGGASGRRARG